jgi:hypothetical protein
VLPGRLGGLAPGHDAMTWDIVCFPLSTLRHVSQYGRSFLAKASQQNESWLRLDNIMLYFMRKKISYPKIILAQALL